MARAWLLGGMMAICVAWITGCNAADANATIVAQSNGRSTSTITSTDPLLHTSLTLPNGQTVRGLDVAHWKDLAVDVRVTSLPGGVPANERYAAIVGNHASIISHEPVTTSAGPGTLVYFERTPPAAAQANSSGSSKVKYEYEVIVYGAEYAYVIDATVTGDLSLAKPEVVELARHWYVPETFSDNLPWTADSRYKPGLTTTTQPFVPAAYEESFLPREGVASIATTSGSGNIQPGQSWTQTTYFSTPPLVIDGVEYDVPARFKGQQLLVLPIEGGIVWAPAKPLEMQHPDLAGSTNVYFTPYPLNGPGTGGASNGTSPSATDASRSLADGSTVIASVPHKWLGFDGPVAGSAWSSWLPKGDVAPAKIDSEIVHQLSFNTDDSVKKDIQHTRAFTSIWPSLFDKSVPETPTGKPVYAAAPVRLIRTEGGFVLQVGFVYATRNGKNAGMDSAYYYWSERTQKWTPLTQLYGVQTITGDFSAGSQAVYWEETVPDSKMALDVAQMYYNPTTNTLKSVWLGNWYFRGSVVDGTSWLTVLANHVKPAGQQQIWTVYTP